MCHRDIFFLYHYNFFFKRFEVHLQYIFNELMLLNTAFYLTKVRPKNIYF